MRLTPARVAALPLATAIVDPAGEVIAWSPEWQGAGLGTVTYAAGSSTLLVNPVDQSGSAGELVAALLGELAAAETVSAPGTGRQLRLLGAALRLVVGRRPDGVGTVADVLADLAALAALHPTCPVAVEPTPRPDVAVAGPATVAMALGQLVRNAVQHDGATSIRLMVADGPTFVLRWQPTVAPRAPMTRTSRAVRRRLSAPRSAGVGQSDHRGWGLGYVTLAADALGANR
ncbi:MAG TPA: hypothetical protein VMW49_05385, partial [Candidatus Dormibacteraeota bacterium]|nr:hypothetical protein [Candidatus Dormibacteraeota bacterium]